MKLYEKLADAIGDQIQRGVVLPGDRIPSVRQTSLNHHLSITTVIRAYLLLESRGMIESRPQSGYFVRARSVAGTKPATLQAATPDASAEPSQIDISGLVLSTLQSIGVDGAVPLGSPYPDTALFPLQRINRYAHAIARQQTFWGVPSELPPGKPELIRQIARRYLENGAAVDPDEIVVTLGATEAINLCLQAVARPGDAIAVESPTFYAISHIIERMGMRVVEVPTDQKAGIDVSALAKLIESKQVDACLLMPNFHNPLGYQMPDERKRELVELTNRHHVPVIENAVYNELYFGDAPPGTLKSYDTQGLVLQCASFSKSLTPALRIGWVLAGRYRANIERLKLLNTLTTPSSAQLAIAEFLENDSYDHHLRRVRRTLMQHASLMRSAVERFFPEGTKMTNPAGGYLLWIELPRSTDSMRLYKSALDNGITIGPGCMFSRSGNFGDAFRLNYSYAWTPEIEGAVVTLGKLASRYAALQRKEEGEERDLAIR
ncbi:UNVERIFIED_ORG: GntR family transcriptional regulator [Burkholderia sp. CF145]